MIFISETNLTFHHLFLQNWDASQETLPYPQAMGDFAVYTKEDFVQSINYAVIQVRTNLFEEFSREKKQRMVFLV